MPYVVKTLTYHHRLCPYCQSKLWLVPAKISLGSPIVRCSSCNSVFTEGLFREWESLTRLQRANLWAEAIAGPVLAWGLGSYFPLLVLYGILVVTVPAVEALTKALPFGSFLLGSILTVPAVVAGVVMIVVGIRHGRRLRHAIAASKARMADPLYRQQLRDLGIPVIGGPIRDVPLEQPND